MTEEQNDVASRIVQIAESCNQTDGWINLSDLGLAMKREGFDIREHGFFKLQHLIESFPEFFEVKPNEELNPPLPIVRVSKKTETSKSNSKQSKKKNPIASNETRLGYWAKFDNFNASLHALSEMALDEKWHFGPTEKDAYYPILGNYLNYTFFRLQMESKVLYSDEYAAFHTGLVDEKYKSIFALFTPLKESAQPWKFLYFCVPGEEWAGKKLVEYFKPLPQRAHYFDDFSELVYNIDSGLPSVDVEHIIIERTDRLPFQFLEENCPKDFELKNTSSMEFEERQQYYSELGAAIKNDKKTYRYMKHRLDDAIKLAVKRVEWNYKTAIPTYYPRGNKLCLLLPLALLDDDKTDIALIVERMKSGNYLGHSILPLDKAYSNARLIARPESDWLEAKEIEDSEGDD